MRTTGLNQQKKQSLFKGQVVANSGRGWDNTLMSTPNILTRDAGVGRTAVPVGIVFKTSTVERFLEYCLSGRCRGGRNP